jgi:hypothetical protein
VEAEVNQICMASVGDSDWESVKEKLEKRRGRREKNISENPEKALVLRKTKGTRGRSLEENISVMAEPVLMRKVTFAVKQQYERFLKRNIFAPVTTNALGKFVADLERFFNNVVGTL